MLVVDDDGRLDKGALEDPEAVVIFARKETRNKRNMVKLEPQRNDNKAHLGATSATW